MRPERDALKELLSTHLKDTGLFFALDHTKLKNMDSINLKTRRQHYSVNKGFGNSGFICVNIFGQVIFAEYDKNCNSVSNAFYIF